MLQYKKTTINNVLWKPLFLCYIVQLTAVTFPGLALCNHNNLDRDCFVSHV